MATLNNPRGMATSLVILLVVILATVVTLFWRQSVPTPSTKTLEAVTHLGARGSFTLEVAARRGKLLEVEVQVMQGEKTAMAQRVDLRNRGASETTIDVDFDTKALQIGEGEALVVIIARDDFKRVREPDAVALEFPVTIDLTPPKLNVKSATRYPEPGGAGVAVLESSGAKEISLIVGERRFRTYEAQTANGSAFVGFFALEVGHDADVVPIAEAIDHAGNIARRQLPVVLRNRPVRTGSVSLSYDWMRNKLPDLLPQRTDWEDEHLDEAFLEVSVGQRAEAASIRQELSDMSTSPPLWEGAFAQLPNSQATSLFGVRRTYMLNGTPLDERVHQGYDLASLAQAEIPAANRGRVVYASTLTLYGETVIVDHGLGVMTLYGHCSSLDVSVGDIVERGQTVARTGATGLAGGDHLHFEVIVGGVPVSPLEWWDRSWVNDRVNAVLRDGGVTGWPN